MNTQYTQMWAIHLEPMVPQISDSHTLKQRAFAGSLSHSF